MPRALFSLLMLVVFTATPLVAAQGPVATPSAGCIEEECDPLMANGGVVKTDGPVRVILFAHFWDDSAFNSFHPLTLASPAQMGSQPFNRGPPTATVNVDPAAVHFRNNRIVFDYAGSSRSFAFPTTSPETHGLANTVHVVGDTMWFYWYMSPGGPNTNRGAAPCIGLYARVETGRFSFSTASTILAEGDLGGGYGASAPADLCKGATLVSRPPNDDVYEFRIPLTVLEPDIPSIFDGNEGGFTITVVPYQLSVNPSVDLLQPEWRMRGGAQYPPRLVLDITNPLQAGPARLERDNGFLKMQWAFLSPLGAADYNQTSLTVDIDGPVHKEGADIQRVVENSTQPLYADYLPENATWAYDHASSPLPDGDYVARFRVETYQRTFQVSRDELFRVSNGKLLLPDASGKYETEAKETAAPAFSALVLGILCAAGVAAARRRE